MVSALKTITSPPSYTRAQLWPSLVKEVTWLVYWRWIGCGAEVREEAEELVPVMGQQKRECEEIAMESGGEGRTCGEEGCAVGRCDEAHSGRLDGNVVFDQRGGTGLEVRQPLGIQDTPPKEGG
jgi:hypothetical protein